jgi:murein DD-endopeptidase MepM/ murein hydrolase activator NlpD
MMKTAAIVRLVIVFCLIATIMVQAMIIRKTNRKLQQVVILDVESDSLVSYSPEFLETQTIVLTPRYVDRFSLYQSPFRDGKDFSALLKEYIRSNWADQYGAKRGSKKCRRIHEGTDLFAPENTPVYPIGAYGVVTEVSDNPHFMIEVPCTLEDGTASTTMVEYGKIVRIAYPEGIESVYAHLNTIDVELGQEVFADTKIGETGVTGNLVRSGKPSHLHLELRDANHQSFDARNRLRYDKTNFSHFLKLLNLGETDE